MCADESDKNRKKLEAINNELDDLFFPKPDSKRIGPGFINYKPEPPWPTLEALRMNGYCRYPTSNHQPRRIKKSSKFDIDVARIQKELNNLKRSQLQQVLKQHQQQLSKQLRQSPQLNLQHNFDLRGVIQEALAPKSKSSNIFKPIVPAAVEQSTKKLKLPKQHQNLGININDLNNIWSLNNQADYLRWATAQSQSQAQQQQEKLNLNDSFTVI